MKLASVLNKNNILVGVKGTNRQDIYMEMLRHSALPLPDGLSNENVYEALIHREDQLAMPYELLAMPHVRINSFQDLHILIGILEKPIRLKPEDTGEVEVVVMSFLSDNMSDLYLKSLSAVVRFFRDTDNMQKVLECADGEEVLDVIKKADVAINSTLTAADVMNTANISVNINASLAAALDIFVRTRELVLAVVDDDNNLVGEIRAEHIIKNFIPEYVFMMDNLNFLTSFKPFETIIKEEHTQTVRSFVEAAELVITPDMPLIQFAVHLASGKVRNVCVTDADNKLLGKLGVLNIVVRVLRG